MNKHVIALLPPEVVNQIAAGEVVTRPAAVVRELLDNALDAGATDIRVEIESGGKKRVLVRDNGCGMDESSLRLSVQPHATSKIRTIDDLQTLRSLGFRGEALPSILSVSRMEVLTAESGATGGHKLVGSGKSMKVSPAAAPPGTTVIIRDLFWNVPARRKFLRSDSSETRAITETIIERALSHPDVALRYVRDDQEVFALPGSSTLADRIRAVFGRDIAAACIAFDRASPSRRVRGFASDPSVIKSTRSSIYLFVNGRRVQEPRLMHTVLTVYREIIDEGFPAVFLFLDVDPHLVDVNVHPAKAEVRFSDASLVYSFAADALSEAIHRFRRPEGPATLASGSSTSPAPLVSGSTDPSAVSSPTTPAFSSMSTASAVSPAAGNLTPAPIAQSIPSVQPLFAPVAGRYRVLGQIYRTFILAEDLEPSKDGEPGGLWIIDQHVASERVILSRLMERIESHALNSQSLLVPLVLELGLKDSILFERAAPPLRRMGFEVEPFGPRGVWVVRAVPTLLGRRVADRKLFLKFVEELGSFDMTRRAEQELFHDVLAHFSCRSAIKAGDTLLPEEQSKLLSDLLSVEHFRICPHGRPSMIQITQDELERRFLRK